MAHKAIIIGASSGIGRALAELFAQQGSTLGLMARRHDELLSLKNSLSEKSLPKIHTHAVNITQVDATISALTQLAAKMGGVDLIIICAGVGYINPDLEQTLERETVETNVLGFTAVSAHIYNLFKAQGFGHIVGLSSIAAARGGAQTPAYNASKAYISNYLEGVRIKAFKDNVAITVTEVRPGFVDTAMAKGEGLFWVVAPQVAAEHIWAGIQRQKRVVYVTPRWRLIWLFLKSLPYFLYKRL